jgi:hypothetical protein
MRRAVLLQIQLQLAPIDTSLATGRGKYICGSLGQHGYTCVISHTLLYLAKTSRRKILWHAMENKQDATVDLFVEKMLLHKHIMYDMAISRDYARIFDIMPCSSVDDPKLDGMATCANVYTSISVIDKMIKLQLTNSQRVKEVAISCSSSQVLQYVIDNGCTIDPTDIAEAERVNCTDHIINMLRGAVKK